MTPSTPLAMGLRRATWIGFAIIAILIPLLPLGHQSDAWLVPDLLYCLTLIWVIREPRIIGVGTVAMLGLACDIFLGRPIGLGAIMLVLTSEAFRQQARFFQENMFLLEWAAAVVFFMLAQLGMSLVLVLTFTDPPQMGNVLAYVLGTAIAYPLIAGLLYASVKVRAPQPGQVSDRLGRVR